MLARLRAPHLYSATHCSTLSPLQLYELHRGPRIPDGLEEEKREHPNMGALFRHYFGVFRHKT